MANELEGKLIAKDYSKFSIKKLNKILKLRQRQIERHIADTPTTTKSLNQLQYERDAIANTLMERAMTQ